MKVLFIVVLSIHLQLEAVIPEKLELPERIEYKCGRANRRDRRKKR